MVIEVATMTSISIIKYYYYRIKDIHKDKTASTSNIDQDYLYISEDLVR